MTPTWHSERPPDDFQPIGILGCARALSRGIPLVLLILVGLTLLLVVRLFESPLYGARRPVTPWITLAVCRGALFLLGFKYTVLGKAPVGPGALVANHSSWIDIFALNASQPLYFVAKSEVAGWAGIGWLARATGTLFIRRNRQEAAAHRDLLTERLSQDQRLLFFPEGTSSDGQRVLPFKPTLFQAFFDPDLRENFVVQPITVAYHTPNGANPTYYAWWGDMALAPHLLKTLAARRQGRIDVIYHTPAKPDDFANRKTLAHHVETQVRAGLEAVKPSLRQAS